MMPHKERSRRRHRLPQRTRRNFGKAQTLVANIAVMQPVGIEEPCEDCGAQGWISVVSALRYRRSARAAAVVANRSSFETIWPRRYELRPEAVRERLNASTCGRLSSTVEVWSAPRW